MEINIVSALETKVGMKGEE